jgi:hypothetical protein
MVAILGGERRGFVIDSHEQILKNRIIHRLGGLTKNSSTVYRYKFR